jgi:hypothetical protein
MARHILDRVEVHLPGINTNLVGWWYTYPSKKYDFVSWDDDIPNIWKVTKAMFQSPPTSNITL